MNLPWAPEHFFFAAFVPEMYLSKTIDLVFFITFILRGNQSLEQPP